MKLFTQVNTPYYANPYSVFFFLWRHRAASLGHEEKHRTKWNKTEDATCWCLSPSTPNRIQPDCVGHVTPITTTITMSTSTSIPIFISMPTASFNSCPVLSSLPISRLRGAALFVAVRRTLCPCVTTTHTYRLTHTPAHTHTFEHQY